MAVDEPIVIVGLGCVFPGAATPSEFWAKVAQGLDATSEIPSGRWPLDPVAFHDSTVGKPDHAYSTRGGFVGSADVDTGGLRIDEGTLQQLDPLFHLALHAAKQAWLSSKTHTVDPNRVGVILGHIVLPTETSTAFSNRILGKAFDEAQGLPDVMARRGPVHPLNVFPAGLPAKIVARALGLKGTAYTLDAACASSLYAVALAVEQLRSGRADAMIAGGLSRPDPLFTQMGFSQLRALSSRGKPAPFDAKADGLVVGEGSGVVVLKRLGDALKHGDRILGVIAGIGLSNDIQGDLLAPNTEGQLRAMREAYRQAKWSPSDVDLLECHATGTPLGDLIEVESLKELWQSSGAANSGGGCVLGSAKSNFGHTLTAAGSAGLIKILLAFESRVLPPTANFDRPAQKLGLDSSPFRVLRSPEPWNRRGAETPRRAGLSAFGFGGINAHLLIEEWTPSSAKLWGQEETIAHANRETRIAVVGMGAHFGEEPGLETFRAKMLRGFADDASTPSDHAITDYAIGLNQFRIPPLELETILPQQSLMLKVAQEAIADASLKPGASLRTGVIVGLGLDLNTTNYHLRWTMPDRADRWVERLRLEVSESGRDSWIRELREASGPALTANRTMGALGGLVASRIAREFRFGGPSFSVSNDELSGNQAIMVAVEWLRSDLLDAAVVGVVDFPCDTRVSAAIETIGNQQRPRTCDGAGAIVLKRLDDALRDGDQIYAVIRETNAATTTDTVPDVRAEAVDAGLIEYTETVDSIDSTSDDPSWNPSVGTLGFIGAATGFAATLKAILCLHEQILPGYADRESTGLDHGTNIKAGPRFWAKNRSDPPRQAAVLAKGLGGAQGLIVLEESPVESRFNRPLARSQPSVPRGRAIFLLAADHKSELLGHIASLEQMVDEETRPIENPARRWWCNSNRALKGRLKIGIVARDRDSLKARLNEARTRLEGKYSPRRPGEHGTLAISPSPELGPPRIAFVYPGLGNSFADMGRELSVLWPEVARSQESRCETYRDQITRGTFWNAPLPSRFKDHVDLIVGQVAVGSLVSDIFRHHGVQPSAAIGYSMGETAALVSLGAWNDRDELLHRLMRSPLFRSELAGATRTARRFWMIPENESIDWMAGLAIGPTKLLRDAVRGNDSVFLLIENSPRESVIGGRKKEVLKVVESLRIPFIEIPAVSTVHCPIGNLVESEYRALHDLPTAPVDVTFYSGVWGTPYRADRKTAADAITAQAGHEINFPAVIERAYADGVRVFLEMGPGASCSRMIDQILGDRPHLAMSACVADRDPLELILNALAELFVRDAVVDLAPLYGLRSSLIVAEQPVGFRSEKASRKIKIQVGLKPFPKVATPPMKPVEEAVPTIPTPKVHVSLKAALPMSKQTEMPIAENDILDHPLVEQLIRTQEATASAHEAYLRVARDLAAQIGTQIERRVAMLGSADTQDISSSTRDSETVPRKRSLRASSEPLALDRDQCLEFAVGSIAKVLGSEFTQIDSYPTRVRLPDEPLMLVDRIMLIEGPARQLGEGRVVTEHDVLPGDWYLDANRIAPSIAIESGQADLFLSGYLGIDFETKGLAVYRLLDATVTFHRGLPGPETVIRYDIRITKFFRQGETHLFRFEFEGTVDGEPLLTMRDGCAGFFSPTELASGKGIVPRPLDRMPRAGIRPDDWTDLVPPACSTLSDGQVVALRLGNFGEAFGPPFDRLDSQKLLDLPGGRMTLVNRVETLDTRGGRFGLGLIRGEADIHPGDWFMVCHFVDDRVMPGTLMYEGCLHTLRIFLMRLGWVGEADAVAYEPIPGVASRLRCRGQVIESTKKVAYEVTIKELGFRPEPYAIADALMYADGRPIVEIADMSLQLTGSNREVLKELWKDSPGQKKASVLFDQSRLLEFASGKPSLAFGRPYEAFDEDRFIARLPRPPYQFLSRILKSTAEPWVMEAGGTVEAEYDVPPDAWYFESDRQERMPFAVLLEIPLQACGWMSAYMGSALRSSESLKFRNLGGTGRQYTPVTRHAGTLRITAKSTKISNSAGMILQHYDFSVSGREGLIYDGKTYFGFFHPKSLAEQVGIRETNLQILSPGERSAAKSFELPDGAPFPDSRWRMVRRVSAYLPDGGDSGLGFVEGTTSVDPGAWFFQAHFMQDPVWPGSLGLESLLQLLKVVASARWGASAETAFETVALGEPHQWEYRGQIVPTNQLVTVQAVITARDDARRFLRADGLLSVDGKVIYQMKGFSLRLIG